MSTNASRTRTLLRYADIALDVIAEGEGPAIVLLPSLGRDSEDFDEVAAGLAQRGHKVLRPQPRGILGSTGPLEGISLHDFARDIALVITRLGQGRAVVAGHAYGNWIARMTAADHPALVRGVVLLAAAAKTSPPHLRAVIAASGDAKLPEAERLAALQTGFFAPGKDPRVWLGGWHPQVKAVQRDAAAAVKQSDWWGAGSAPILEIQAEFDPFKPPSMQGELKAELGDRVTVVMIKDASHALIPEQPAAVIAELCRWIGQLP